MEKLLTVDDFCQATGYSKSWVYLNHHKGSLPLPIIKLGRALRFRQSDVLKWFDEKSKAPFSLTLT